MFKEISKERSFGEILNQIIDNIQCGVLKSGDALPAERVMAERMGVSRPVVREALPSPLWPSPRGMASAKPFG